MNILDISFNEEYLGSVVKISSDASVDEKNTEASIFPMLSANNVI